MHDPVKKSFVDCDGNFIGILTENLSYRKGRLRNLINNGKVRIRCESLTNTEGSGGMNTFFTGKIQMECLVGKQAQEKVFITLFNGCEKNKTEAWYRA